MSDIYKKSGVNVSLGDEFSEFAGQVARASFGNQPHLEVIDYSGHFRGPRAFRLKGLPSKILFTAGSDGTGTKSIVTSAAFAHRTSGCDLVAMLGGDITRWGGKPMLMLEDLSVHTLGKDRNDTVFKQFKDLLIGLGQVAKAYGLVVLGGETAELKDCITSEINDDSHTKFIWSGSMFGAIDPDRIINGRTVETGDVVISLRDGLRANGVSAIRRLLREVFGPDWYKEPKAAALISDAASPSVIYDRLLTCLNGWENVELKVVAPVGFIGNITGGGIYSKFIEPLLRLGHSVELDDLHHAPYCVTEAVRHFAMGDEEAYRTFNCGNGTMFTVPPQFADQVLTMVRHRFHSIEAKVCGRITKSNKPGAVLRSVFTGREVTY